jgi:hypothetical protein
MGLNAQQMEKIAGRVWPAQGMATFALLDGAGIPTLLDKLYASAGLEFECLYSGELAPGVAEAAPYIARLEAGTEFAAWVLAGWGERHGLFAHVAEDVDMPVLRRHFRTLNMVYGPDGSALLFRYYDPCVMHDFLPLCDAAQLKDIFGPVGRYVVELAGAGAGAGLTLSAPGGELIQESFMA